MDGDAGTPELPSQPSGKTQVLLVRFWRDAVGTSESTLRGHVKIAGGKYLGAFNSLAELLALIVAEFGPAD